MILSGASRHISHVGALLAYLCIGTRTQRLYAAVAQQGRHYTYPHQGLEGWSDRNACTACGLAVLVVVVQSSPFPPDGPFDVCPSPFLAEGPSLFGPPHTWLWRVALCVICALGYAGWAAQLITCVCAGKHSRFFFAAVA